MVLAAQAVKEYFESDGCSLAAYAAKEYFF
jgi:hypothetical protein